MSMERLSVDNLSVGMGILARKSLSSQSRKASQVSLLNDAFAEHNHHAMDDRNWSWSYLRRSFKLNELGGLYDRYQRRLQNAYFNVFLLLQGFLSLCYIAILMYVSIAYAKTDIQIKGCNSTALIGADCIAKNNLELAIPEVIVHLIIAVYCFIVFGAVYDEKLFRAVPNLQIVISMLTCFVILGADVALSVYFYQTYHQARTSSAFQTFIIIYFFLPVPRKLQAASLGAIVAMSHLTTSALLFYSDDDRDTVSLVIADAVFYLCGNAVGVYSRLLTEVAIRRAFMDRRGYIKSTIKKNYEKTQEDELLQSILPERISEKVKEELRNAIRQIEESLSQSSHPNSHHRNSNGSNNPHGVMHHKKPFSDLFVERHDNVTVLYADIVNFTPLTVKMKADELVETLNELFGRFDDAATKHSCVRIKLLGDCYYCVSGLNESTPDHAKNCILLGFDMIEIIKEVKFNLKVDLAMRIGVHSGNILSGLLGIYKWQFDIWSRDVTIAQHMEQSGKPGCVHITKQTKDILKDEFTCEPGYGRLRDKYLRDNNVETYFIKPPTAPDEENHGEGEEADEFIEVDSPKKFHRSYPNISNSASPNFRRGSNLTGGGKAVDYLIRRKSIRPVDRRINLSGNDVVRYLSMIGKVNQQMEQAIDEMPLRKSEQWCPGRDRHKNSLTNQVNPYTMSFSELSSELHFQSQPDPLFKFYIACSLFVIVCIGVIQAVTVPPDHVVLWLAFGGGLSYLLLLMPFVWVGYIWSRIKDPHRELDCVPEPENRIVRYFFQCSHKVSGSLLLRVVLYLSICLFISTFAIIDVIECTPDTDCRSPWYFTFSCSLAILIIYAFFRIHYFLKLLMSGLSLAGYFTTIYHFRPEVFSQNNGVSPSLSVADAELLSHVIYLLWITLLLHIMDRQMEYINRLDFVWKRKLTEEHREASLTHDVNTILIHNILPMQIAKIYLDPNRAGEGYSRTHQNVSIMFASIPNFMDFYTENDLNKHGLVCLNVLNQIITEFDQALFHHLDVEKIKVIGSTYMAACGLEVQDSGRLSTTSFLGTEGGEHVSWRDYSKNNGTKNPEKRRKTLLTLVKFASDMMIRLQVINRESFQDFQLRVGVSTGLVVAGVVGARKPLFDTWSDTVNLASRLDSHGEVGKIHLEEYGAELLKQEGIKCEYRGNIFIKGKGNMNTYFVCMNDQYQIQYLLGNEEKDLIFDDSTQL